MVNDVGEQGTEMTASVLDAVHLPGALESDDQFSSVFGVSRGTGMAKDDLTIKEAAAQICLSAENLWVESPKAYQPGASLKPLLEQYLQLQQALVFLDHTLIRERGYGIAASDFTTTLPEYFASTPRCDLDVESLHGITDLNRVKLFGMSVGRLLIRHEWTGQRAKKVWSNYMWQCWFNNLTQVHAPELLTDHGSRDDRVVLRLSRDTNIDPFDEEAALAWLYDMNTLKQALPLAQEMMLKRIRLYMQCDISRYFRRW